MKKKASYNKVMTIYMRRYWKVLGWCAVIFIISSIPSLPKVGFIWWDFVLKKSGHVLVYAVLYTLAFKALNAQNNWRTPFLFGLAFALSDEYHQSFVPGRTALLTDVGFDMFGMFLAYWKLKS